MNHIDSDRRSFLKASVVLGGGLMIGFALPSLARTAQKGEPAVPFHPNAWIRITPDDSITLIVAKVEMGQGVYTSMPMLVAEELEVDLNKVRIEDAPPGKEFVDPLLGIQATGGSTSVRSGWKPLREAGAAARMMLLAAAAETWKVTASECRAENGVVFHARSKRRLSYGQLVEAASRQAIPDKIILKNPENYRYLGKAVPRRDTPAKVNGSAVYGIDVKLPGLLTAVFLPCPVFGGQLKSVDDSVARAVKGVKQVFRVENGVAVAAEGFWAAKLGRDALKVEWDDGPLVKLDSATIESQFEKAVAQPGATARNDGDVAPALSRAAKTVEAAYHSPYLAHATMEPMNCTVDLRAEGCQIWVGTQAPGMVQDTVAHITGLSKDKIRIHLTYLGGGFGRRFEQDFISQAVNIAKQVKAPVKLIWTREDDIQHDFYRPASFSRLRAGLDTNGRPTAWEQRIASPSIFKRLMPQLLEQDGKLDHSSVEGAFDHPYAIPNVRVDYCMTDPGVPVGFWRSVGNSQNGFVTESFIDELAHAAGQDPLKFRLQLLEKKPRHRTVLELAAEKAGWGKPLPKGEGRGIAVVNSFGSTVAEVAEVAARSDETITVKRIVLAIDCGIVVNPDTVKAQMESAVAFALTATLKGPITVQDGRIEQGNFHDYPLLRLDEMPKVEVYILSSDEAPGGVGEPGVPPLAPAVANAVFAATGKRIRRLPLDLKSADS